MAGGRSISKTVRTISKAYQNDGRKWQEMAENGKKQHCFWQELAKFGQMGLVLGDVRGKGAFLR